MRTTRILAAVAAAAGLALVVPTSVAAQPTAPPAALRRAPAPIVKSSALAAPFNINFGRGKVWVADGGLNMVGTLKRDKSIHVVASNQPGASGVATKRKRLAFTTTVSNPATFENTASGLHIWGPIGKRIYANTLAYETKYNPDKVNHYGVRNPSQCVKDAFAAAQFPVDYVGAVDSHAYSVTAWGSKWVVADAGSNTLWKVDNSGRISTLSVLPPQPLKITAAMASALGLPACVVGITYAFEPVPTDVEVGKNGWLYVTVLPGGPESPVLGARGKVYKVNPRTGRAYVVASGFLGATNLALGKHGKMYVAELFGAKITLVRRSGKKSTYAMLPGVVAVETTRRGTVWAATLGNEETSTPGTIVKFTKGKRHTMGQRVD